MDTPAPTQSKPRVLVVEDYEDLVYVTNVAFAHAGIDVVNARTATEALQVSRDLVSRGETVDCALIDLYLPDMDGLDLAAPLREALGPKPRFAAYTVRVSDADRARSLSGGFDAHFPKPSSMALLTEWVHSTARKT